MAQRGPRGDITWLRSHSLGVACLQVGEIFPSGAHLTLELLSLPSSTRVLPFPGDGPGRCKQAAFSSQERGQVPLTPAAL